MGKLIRNNLANFLMIFIITALVGGGIFYYLAINIKGAEIQEIKILPTTYSGSWQNPDAALVQNLGPEADFKEFNEENSAHPMPAEAGSTKSQAPPASLSEVGRANDKQIQNSGDQIPETIEPDETIASPSEGFEEVSSPSETTLEKPIIPPPEEEILLPSESLEEVPASPSESARVPYVLGILLDLIASDSEEVIQEETASESEEELLIEEPIEKLATESEIYPPEADEISPPAADEIIETEISEIQSPTVSALEFSDFSVVGDFAGQDMEIKNVQLRLSMAFESGVGEDRLTIEYSHDSDPPAGEAGWNYLAEHSLSDSGSNAINDGYWLYGLPIFEKWEDLGNLRIRFTHRGTIGDVYLDAIWLEVEYGKYGEEERLKEDIEKVLRRAFDLLRQDVEEQLGKLKKTKSRRTLKEEEERIEKELKKDLDTAERYIRREVRDVKEELERKEEKEKD